jgi:hypothetical protein
MTEIRVKKLDKRYPSKKHFDFVITPHVTTDTYLLGIWQSERYRIYQELRNWCWKTWGSSCEYQLWKFVPEENRSSQWAWDTHENRLRIYIASEKELAWLRIKFP